MLDSAGLIIQSYGFSSNFPALFIDGQATHLSPQSQQGELSDAQSEKIIEGLFAIGLGVQVTPAVDYRGEASFDGAVNSLQIYPLSAAPLIISKILQRDAQPMCG